MVKFILGHRVLECIKGKGDVYEHIKVLAPKHVSQYSNSYMGYTIKEVMELVREDFKSLEGGEENE